MWWNPARNWQLRLNLYSLDSTLLWIRVCRTREINPRVLKKTHGYNCFLATSEKSRTLPLKGQQTRQTLGPIQGVICRLEYLILHGFLRTSKKYEPDFIFNNVFRVINFPDTQLILIFLKQCFSQYSCRQGKEIQPGSLRWYYLSWIYSQL